MGIGIRGRRWGGRWIWIASVLLSLATLPAATPATSGASVADGGVVCESRALPIVVRGVSLRIAGTYCRPADADSRTGFVLVPGATYRREYWDFGFEPETYSFARAMAARGYAALALDRLGTGASSQPPGAMLSASVQADAVHQVVAILRDSGLGDGPLERVILGGHSLGSWIGLIEAATFRDVDGVLLTGLTHSANAPSFLALIGSSYPAALDPAFSGRGLDPGYLTTMPGTRGARFYAPGQAPPGVIARDEATKDVVAVTELGDGLVLGTLLPYSSRIDAPVLLAIGGADPYFCGPPLGADCSSPAALVAAERPYYARAPSLDAIVVPGVGHDVNLFRDASAYHSEVAAWAAAAVAR